MEQDPQLERIRPVAQAMGQPDGYVFRSEGMVPAEDLAELTDLRVSRPEFFAEALASRPRRKRLTDDGKLVLLAADHPARMVTGAGAEPLRMADRADYLSRIVRVLAETPIDGLMATPDVIDDVVALDALARQRGDEGFLGQRVLVGSMNRSGLQNAAHELWDMPTGYRTAAELRAANLDGGKILWRYLPKGEANRESLETMVAMAGVASDLAEADMTVFIEPLAVEVRFDKLLPSRKIEDWVRVVGAASALGPSTARAWVKIPFVTSFERVAAATTLPVLMLGGPAKGVPASVLVDFADGMQAAGNVRGTLVGRNVLYPGADDPAVMGRAVCHLVRDGLPAEEAAAKAGEAGRLE